MESEDHRSPSPSLLKALGPWDGAAILVSNVVGIGIFTTPGIVAGLVPSVWGILGVWTLGGILALIGSLAYAELAALRPHSGGEYVYLREAFGPLAGFMTGWISFVAGFSGAIAAGAVALADYLGHFFPAAADSHPYFSISLHGLTMDLSFRDVIALSAIALISLVHILGLRMGRPVQNTLTALLVLLLLIFIVVGFTRGAGSSRNFTSAPMEMRFSKWLLALAPVMFTYSGWNAAGYVAEEFREPKRNVPRSLLLGTGIVVLLYLMLNLLYLYALPVRQMTGVIRVGDLAAEALFGSGVANIMAVLILISLAGGLSAWIVTGPRIYYAMARDGAFLRSAARIHPRFRSPAVSIVAQSLWSGILVLSGTFEQLLIYTGFAVLLFSGGAVVSLFVLRRKLASEERPFQTWGYPVLPAFFVVITVAILAYTVFSSPRTTGAGVLIMLLGLPVYFWSKRRVKA